MRILASALLVTLATVCTGCASPVGFIYTHTVQPLSTDFNETRVVVDKAAGDVKEIDYYVQVSWSANGIGQIAKEHGFKQVFYADLETLSVMGIWSQKWVHVYGTR